MDTSLKPEKKNLKEDANSISTLLFLWLIPILRKGSVNNNDLTTCLKQDRSADLGDKLER